MKLKYIFIWFFFFCALTYSQDYYTIEGYIFDGGNGDKLIGTNVILKDLNIGVATDINGSFTLNNIPEGKHIISYSLIGYITHTDTIILEGDNKTVNVRIILPPYHSTIIRNPEIEDYHSRLKEIAEKDSLLKIHIDSLGHKDGKVIVYSTFTNLSTEPIYVIKERPCFRVIKLLGGPKIVSLECDTPPYTLINKSELLEIKPKQSIKYPPTEFFLYSSISPLPDVEYKLGLKYNFGGPSSLGGIFTKPEDDAILIALRGEYFSDNFLYFNK